MMNDTSKVEEIAVERLSDYCEFVLGSLSRVDQRRLGEIYAGWAKIYAAREQPAGL